ncbi:hypothetical protein ANANG_G00168860 [Anguilla anguilla]|uniref:Uncharacterized protein n=1 Tax=Anguilla anguilla TaxID=7936 RepID=A0A9D3RW70_ANGAN|nr:hypothetical protein ANANG_G00168860 [Anguilla anguilla]
MGSVTSALTKTRNTVKVSSEPQHEPDRSNSAPGSAPGKRRSIRSNVFSSQRSRQNTRQSLSEVLNGQDGGGVGRALKAVSSKSPNAVWNALTAGTGGRDRQKEKPEIPEDPRTPEEVLAEEPPSADGPEAPMKAAIRIIPPGLLPRMIITLAE